MRLFAIIDSIAPEVVDLQIEGADKSVKRRAISLQAFIKALSQCNAGSEMRRIGKLPQGYLDSELSLVEKGTFRISVEIPAAKRSLLYYNDVYEVPFPSLVFYFEVNEKRLTVSRCFASGADDRLYRYPFGNVHDDGKICWGNIKLPTINNMEEINILVSMFLSSVTNDDLYKNPNGITSQRELITKIKDLDEFPEEYLKEIVDKKSALI